MAQTEEEEKQKKQAKTLMDTILGWINPFDGGGFSIGGLISTLFTTALIGTGLYFLARNEKVQEWVGKWFDGDKPGSGKEKIAGMIDGINAFIEDKLPAVANLLGIKGAAGKYAESRSDEDLLALLQQGEVPENMAKVIVKHRVAFFDTVKEANDGVLSKDNFTNDKTLFTLLTSSKPAVKVLVNELLPTISITGSGDGKPNPILPTLRTLVASSNFDTLMNNDQYRTRFAEIALKLAPSLPLSAQALSDSLKGFGTEKIRKLMTNLLTEDADGKLPDPAAIVQNFLNNPVTQKDPATQQVVGNLLEKQAETIVGKENLVPFNTLKAVVPETDLMQFVAAATTTYSQDPAENAAAVSLAQFKFIARDMKTVQAFKTFADQANIAALPQMMQEKMGAALQSLKAFDPKYLDTFVALAARNADPQAIQAMFVPNEKGEIDLRSILNPLFSSANRELLARAHPNNVARLVFATLPEGTPEEKATKKTITAMATPANIMIISNVAAQIEARTIAFERTNNVPEDQLFTGVPATRAKAVLSAIVSMVSGNSEEFKKLPSTTVAWFFKDPGYSAIIEHMLDPKTGLTLPAGQGKMLAALRAHWGTITEDKTRKNEDDRNGWGLAEVLSDPKAVKALTDHMGTGNGDAKKISGAEQFGYGIVTGIKYWFGNGMNPTLYENINHAIALNNAVVDVTHGTPVAPKPTAPANNSSVDIAPYI